MPLELSLYNREGVDDFFVDGIRVSLEEIRGEFDFKLKVHGTAIDKVFTINNERSIEIIPQVRVSAGAKKRGARPHEVSVVLEAPRRIEIHRGKIYRERQAQAT